MRKSKPPRAEYFLICWIIVFILIIVFAGCLTAKKASKQQDRIIEKYPSIAAQKLRARFPIIERETIITVIDSAEFVRQRDSSLKEAAKSKKSLDSIREKIKTLPEAVKEVCADYELIIDGLTLENVTLNRLMANQKPVIIYKDRTITVEDSSKIYQLVLDRDEWKQLYAIDHDWRVLKEKKEKGKLVILIPWWLIIFILVAGAGFVFLGIKNKTFNLVKLATKTLSYVSKKKKETRP